MSSCFVFHMVTATERDDRIELRAVRYRRLLDSGMADPLTGGGQLWQWRMDLHSGTVAEQQLDDRLQELPRTDPATHTAGARFHYAITAGSDRIESHAPDALLKHDHHHGVTEVRQTRAGTVPGEAMFVPDPRRVGQQVAAGGQGMVAAPVVRREPGRQ